MLLQSSTWRIIWLTKYSCVTLVLSSVPFPSFRITLLVSAPMKQIYCWFRIVLAVTHALFCGCRCKVVIGDGVINLVGQYFCGLKLIDENYIQYQRLVQNWLVRELSISFAASSLIPVFSWKIYAYSSPCFEYRLLLYMFAHFLFKASPSPIKSAGAAYFVRSVLCKSQWAMPFDKSVFARCLKRQLTYFMFKGIATPVVVSN